MYSTGKRHKTVMSQRDVPGLSRAALPILKAAGIRAISVGVNGGSTPPNVPKVFIWNDDDSGTAMRTMYLQGGYGGIAIFPGLFDYTAAPGLKHVMVVDWRGDNAGPPPTPADVEQHFAQIRKEFPGATVKSSTFEEWVDILDTVSDTDLPQIHDEIGDSWIHGVASDPLKHAQVRAAQRARSECVAGGRCLLSDSRFWVIDKTKLYFIFLCLETMSLIVVRRMHVQVLLCSFCCYSCRITGGDSDMIVYRSFTAHLLISVCGATDRKKFLLRHTPPFFLQSSYLLPPLYPFLFFFLCFLSSFSPFSLLSLSLLLSLFFLSFLSSLSLSLLLSLFLLSFLSSLSLSLLLSLSFLSFLSSLSLSSPFSLLSLLSLFSLPSLFSLISLLSLPPSSLPPLSLPTFRFPNSIINSGIQQALSKKWGAHLGARLQINAHSPQCTQEQLEQCRIQYARRYLTSISPPCRLMERATCMGYRRRLVCAGRSSPVRQDTPSFRLSNSLCPESDGLYSVPSKPKSIYLW